MRALAPSRTTLPLESLRHRGSEGQHGTERAGSGLRRVGDTAGG